MYARYLPEIECDLHIHFIRNGTRIHDVEYLVMNGDGIVERIERPTTQLDFVRSVGAPFDMRALWRRFIEANVYEEEVVVEPVEPGFYIGLRPYADTATAVSAMAEPFHRWIEKKQAEEDYDIIAYFKDREDDDIPVPYSESYHVWLGGFASEVERALVEPFMFVSSNRFVDALDRQARLYGLSARRLPGEDRLNVEISAGDLRVELNLAPTLFRILHEGLTFERGLRKHFCNELRALTVSAETLSLIRAALPQHTIQIKDGHYFEVFRPNGESLGMADMVRTATAYNVRREDEFNGLMAALDPEATPEPVTLGPPCAGRLSSVVRRREQTVLDGAHPQAPSLAFAE